MIGPVGRTFLPDPCRACSDALSDASGGDILTKKKRRAVRRLAAGLILALGLSGAARAELIGDAEKGAKAFGQCKGCHQVGKGAEDRIGPHLNGIFGRRAGIHEGFA